MPTAAQTVGYTLNTYSIRTFSTANVDTGITFSSGYKVYFDNWFGNIPTLTGTTINANGSITTYTATNNGNLVSAGSIISSPFYVGIGFGGGAYFEATISFDPTMVAASTAWPAFWLEPLEHLIAPNGPQWSGQAAGYAHFLENDIFEYDRSTLYQYGSTLHDIYGIYGTTCSPAFCDMQSTYSIGTVSVPNGVNWLGTNRIGCLWVPATVSTNGYYTYYFNDIPQATFTYSQFTTQVPPPTSTWTFGVGDNLHFAILLGSGWGPLTVTSLQVWQATGAGNWTN